MTSTSQHGYVSDLITGPPPTSMTYNRLGKSGLKVSSVILGAMSFGSKDWQKWVLEEDEALPLLGYAYEVGINTWDTVSFNPPSYLTSGYVLSQSPFASRIFIRMAFRKK
jgi:hypothetical protein